MLKQLFNEISVFDILFFLGIILILVALLQKNSNFLDVRKIVRQHLSIFSKSPLQVVAIFGAPLLIAIAAAATHPLTVEIVNNLNVVLSILISMFFAMLIPGISPPHGSCWQIAHPSALHPECRISDTHCWS